MWHIYIVYTSMAAEQNHIINKSLERYTTVLFHSKEAKWNVLGKVCPPNCAQRKIMRKTMIMPGIKSWTSKQIRYASAFCARYARLGHHKGGQERRNIDTHTQQFLFCQTPLSFSVQFAISHKNMHRIINKKE